MVINGNSNDYIRQILFWDTPGRPVDQLLFLLFGAKYPIFGPKIGPKWSKMAQNGPNCRFAAIVATLACKVGLLLSFFDLMITKVGEMDPDTSAGLGAM